MPRRRPDPELRSLTLFPNQLWIGDRFTEDGKEWEVASQPVPYKQGHDVRAMVQRPGNPNTAREKFWEAIERVTVRRPAA